MGEITNNVLVERMKGITTLINEKFEENEKSHNIILLQTTKTNGRVRSLEIWRSFIVGGLSILTFMLPFAFYFINK